MADINASISTPAIDASISTPAITSDVTALVHSGDGVPAGGTGGQVLTKDSGTDYDTSWQDVAAALDDLTDVAITSPSRFDAVMHDGSQFVNQPTQRARTVILGATAGLGGDQTIPDGTSFVFFLGSIGTVTLPDVVAHDGQMLTIYNLTGATVTVASGGSDLVFPPGGPSLEIGEGGVVEFSALDLTGIFGTFWIPGVRSGADYNIPYFLGQGIPDGYVVAMTTAGTAPAWQDPNGLIDLGSDPPWGEEPVVTTKVMRLDYAGNPGNSDGAWSTPELADLTSGVDLRARIWFDYPSDVNPSGGTDRYMEVFTQEHPTAGGGDTIEAAILWADDTFGSGVIEGQPHTFYESARVGIGTDPERNGGWKRAGLVARTWVDLRWTQDFATGTVTYWRAVPFEVSDSSEQVDGIWWWPIASTVHTDFTGIDTTATSPWWIGLRFTGYVSWLKMTNYAGTTTYVDINAADLDALTLGATSFTDDAGNTWTTTAGAIAAAP